MRILTLATACVALAACGSKDEPAAEATAAATPTAEATTAAAGPSTGSLPGTYEVKNADGTVVTEVIAADGTYSDTRDGATVEKGKWRADGAKTCFDPDGSDPEQCFTTGTPGADGTFTVIGADGKETGVTVRKTG